jgi:hypothetical protein
VPPRPALSGRGRSGSADDGDGHGDSVGAAEDARSGDEEISEIDRRILALQSYLDNAR